MKEIKINVTLTKEQADYVLEGLYTFKEISNRNRSGYASSLNPIIKLFDRAIKKEIGAGQ